MSKSRKYLKNRRNTLRKRHSRKLKTRVKFEKNSKKNTMELKKMTGGMRYDFETIQNVSEIFFGGRATIKFPIFKMTYRPSTGIFYTTTTIPPEIFLLTPGSIFKSTTLYPSGKARHTGLNIITDVLRSGNNITGLVFLPIYILPKISSRLQKKGPNNAKGNSTLSEETYPTFMSLIDTLTITQEQKATQLPGVDVNLGQECDPLTSPASCNLGFEIEQPVTPKNPDGTPFSGRFYPIKPKYKKIDVNSGVTYSTAIQGITVIAYDKFEFNPTVNGPPLDEPVIVQKVETCKSFLQKYLSPTSPDTVIFSVGKYGLSQISGLVSSGSYDINKAFESNFPLEPSEFVEFGLNVKITGLSKSKFFKLDSSTDLIDKSAAMKLIIYIILFRLTSIENYQFQISRRELFFICNNLAMNSRLASNATLVGLIPAVLEATNDIKSQFETGEIETATPSPQ